MISITVAVWIAAAVLVAFIIGWFGGSHTSGKQSRLITENYQSLTGSYAKLQEDKSKLHAEIDELRSLVFSLQSQLDVYKREVDDLSAKLAMMRHDANNQNIDG